jgi:hypothetical protein
LTEELIDEAPLLGDSGLFCVFAEAASVRAFEETVWVCGVALPVDAFACFTLAVSFDLSELMAHLLE